jgi:hypothetical protein
MVAGVMILLMGVAFYVLQIPLVYFWSVPFVAGGALMSAASLFLPESRGTVQAPEGYRFCIFCGNPVKLEADRCPQCNGQQPRVGA